ncbi:MAG TPA: hypothetical protein VK008_05475 [Sphingobacteriaceae bacterium]|nr:hypothetical protein [Sphingobacteriaceae bacterium]
MDIRWVLVVTPKGIRIHKAGCHIVDRSTERILLENDRQLIEEVRDAQAQRKNVAYCKSCLSDWPGPIRSLMGSRAGS